MDMGGMNSSTMDYLEKAKNLSQTNMENKLSTDYSKASDKELMDVCKQFESYFLEQVLKEMQKTVPTAEDSQSSSPSMVDYFKDSTLQGLAAQSTEQNSLGLAKSLYDQMKRNYDI